MKTPSFLELKTIVEYISDELENSQLQEVLSTEEGLVLGFYRFTKTPRMNYLVFDLDRPFPFIALLNDNPWLKFKKTKPLALFLSAHAKNQYFNNIEVKDSLGRVVFMTLGLGDQLCTIQFRAIPKQVNLIVSQGKKLVSWYPVKELGENDQSYLSNPEEDVRSLAFLTNQWKLRRGGPAKKADSPTVNPYEKWVKSRQRDLEKKKKAQESVLKQIEQFQNEEWSEVGEYLKTHGLKKLKPEWSIYVDFKKSASENMQKCFEKAKAAKNKIVGAQARIISLNEEVEFLADLSEAKFEEHLTRLQKKASKGPGRKVEGRLRKIEIVGKDIVAYMGKSAADNMTLLRNSKPHDIWMHLKDYPSAHAVIHRQKNQNLADSDLVYVGKWLVSEGLSKSQTQMGGKYAVVYVECRHVKPLKGDKMGRVTYHNAREFLIAL